MQNPLGSVPAFSTGNVATALGYSKPLNAIAMHVDEDDSLKWGLIDSKGRKQQAIVINESGLCSLILSSKLEQARAFKRWVTNEVLAAQGYKNAGKALTDHVEENDVTKRYPIVDSLGLPFLHLDQYLPQSIWCSFRLLHLRR